MESLFPGVTQNLFILTRLTGLMMVAPMFAGKMVPVRFRFFLAMAVTFLVGSARFSQATELPQIDFWLALGGELFFGLTAGTAVLFFFEALRVAGNTIAHTSGISFPVDAGFSNEAATLFSRFFYFLGIAVIFLTNGHHLILEGILRSFEIYPPGEVFLQRNLFRATWEFFLIGFSLGLRMALPVVTVLLLSQLGLAVLNRVLPQLNVFSLSFTLQALVVLLVLSWSLGTGLWIFEEGFHEAFTL
ncbi:MAG: flagellar biosynthetic protein FliR [Planctomycetia bacterium]|nr:flagellar biosynthetic protein FliR [Planctomycetia bacterium]